MDHGCCRTGPAPLGQRLAMGAVGTVEASAFNWGRGGLAVRAGPRICNMEATWIMGAAQLALPLGAEASYGGQGCGGPIILYMCTVNLTLRFLLSLRESFSSVDDMHTGSTLPADDPF